MTTKNTKQIPRWSPEEDRILLKQVTAFPHNMKRNFAIVSETIGRTVGAVKARWYLTLAKKYNITYSATVEKTNTDNKTSLWNKILKLLHIK